MPAYLLTQLTQVELNLGYLHCGLIPWMHINWKFVIYFKWKETATQPHGLQQARLPYPLPTRGACSNSVHQISDVIQPSDRLLLPLLLPSIFPSIRVFSNELVLRIRWPKYWSFSFSISSSKEYSGLISFGTDWLHLLAVQGTVKRFHQHIVQKHQFFSAQLSS